VGPRRALVLAVWLLAGVFLMIVGWSIIKDEMTPVGAEVGARAPDFSLPLLAGGEVRLSDFRGKVVFVNFWRTTCPVCVEELPEIQRLYEWAPDDVVVLTVDIGEDAATVRTLLMDGGYGFPVALDGSASVAQQYLVEFIPTSFVIDANGVIREKYVGGLTFEQMKDMILRAREE